MKWTIYHNPKCRKSREALQILHSYNVEPEVVRYLDVPPDEKVLQKLVKCLGFKAFDLIRKEETFFKQNYKGKEMSESEWISLMVRFPILIQRPIIVHGTKAVIGRPPELVLSLMGLNG